ncbi:MAG: membrane dipeptidase [Waddliaceae bacterium]
MIPRPIVDVHCDLLSYLAKDEKRSAYDRAVRCSIPQMRAGCVIGQILPVFTFTAPRSSRLGWMQANLFKSLPCLYPDAFEIIHNAKQWQPLSKDKIGIMPAFENASSFCDEEESLEEAWQRLMEYERKWAKIVYISLTWNTENRFGGGAETSVGLKDDGKRLLQLLHQKHIAVDLSHASDALAHDIFSYLEQQQLQIPVMASHSNFRSVSPHHRNLTDEIAKEIIRREGVIGLNFIQPFVGEIGNVAKHLEHGLRLNGDKHLCFGADFYYEEDVKLSEEPFFSSYPNSGSYPELIRFWKQQLSIADGVLDQISHMNMRKFLLAQIFSHS